MTRIYISGPMTGIEEFNFPAFHEAARKLRSKGFEVVNPAELNPTEKDWNKCMRIDIAALMSCDRIYMLNGWILSKGAKLELHIAETLGFDVMLDPSCFGKLRPALA